VEYVLALIVLLALVAVVVLRPLLRGVGDDERESASREELEAAKEAKYREIRDAQLDLEMGKLSKQDHRAVDRELRAEAIAILARLDALEDRPPESANR
jgi:flagellar biosynthesis/type III secretory pathway M-ring protein FliF/YscJ